jgi:hypothetical protein
MPAGRPPKRTEDTPAQIMRMAGLGLTLDEIALILDINPGTLDRWLVDPEIKKLYKMGRAEIHHKMTTSAYRMALEGDRVMMIFLLKTKFGYREVERHEHTGVGDSPIKVDRREWVESISAEDAAILARYKKEENRSSEEGQMGTDSGAKT